MNTMTFRLLLAATTLLVPGVSLAESADGGAILMPEVVISASRWEESMTDTTDRTTVVTEEEIEAIPAYNAADILNHVVGVDVDIPTTPFNVGFPAVNGAAARQTLIMVNGIPMNTLSEGVGFIGQVPGSAIGRIEVLYGPSGSEWGSMLGGAINVITHDPRHPSANRVSVGLGEHGHQAGDASLNYAGEALALTVSGSMLRGDGPEPDMHKAYKSESGVGAVSVPLGESAELLVQGHTFQGYSSTGDYRRDLETMWFRDTFATHGVGATLKTALPVGEARVTAYHQSQTALGDGYFGPDRFTSFASQDIVNGYSAIWHADTDAATVNIGADARNGELKADTLDEPSYKHNPYGGFVTVQRDLTADWRAQAGVRYSDEDIFGTATTWNLGVLRRFGERSAARFSVSTGYNAPPLGWRYVTGGGTFIPNPDLKAESVTQYETGAHAWVSDALLLDVSLYHAIVKDAINNVAVDPEAGTYTYENFEEFTRQGAQLAVKWIAAEALTINANALWQTVKDELAGETVYGQIRASYAAGISYNDGCYIASVTGQWKDWNADPSYEAKDKELYADAMIGYNYKLGDTQALRVVGTVYNLTDVEIWTDAWLPVNDPRTYEVKVEYRF